MILPEKIAEVGCGPIPGNCTDRLARLSRSKSDDPAKPPVSKINEIGLTKALTERLV